MNLRDYLHFQRITIKAFSESIEMSTTHITGYINGRLRLSQKVARAIERVTDGKVTAKQIMKDNPPKKSIQK
jgi:DNA-binding transcriptional regulator YdaS (Cro superfamily)